MKDKIKHFWDWFAENQEIYLNLLLTLQDTPQDRLDELMQDFEDKLHECCPDIWFRMGGKIAPFELILTAEGYKEHFEKVKEIVSLAPRLEQWQIIAFIPPMDLSTFEYKSNGFVLNENDVFFSYQENPTGENDYYIEAMFYVNDEKFDDSDKYKSNIIRIAETAVGEYDFAKIIGFIDVVRCSEVYEAHGGTLMPIGDLPKVIEVVKTKLGLA